MSLLYSIKKGNDERDSSQYEETRQNQKQKSPLLNLNGSNISSDLHSDKRNIYLKNYSNEEGNSNIFNINGSQSSLSIDLNRFKISPNNFNKNKNNNKSYINNNANIDEKFETFNPSKDQIILINKSNSNLNMKKGNKNENIENSNIYSSKNANKNKQDIKSNDTHPLLKNFNPYDIKIFLGEDYSPAKKGKAKKKAKLVNNIPPSVSNLQMILYNKKIEKEQNKNNPDFIFKEFYQKESRRMMAEYIKVLNLSNENLSVNDIITNENINEIVLLKPIKEKSLNNTINHIDNSFLTSNKKNEPFSILEYSKVDSSNNFLNAPNSYKLVNNFLNDMNDESRDKISLITFLSIPRIMNMIVSNNKKYSFIFYCSPTNISCMYGIETYIFKWNECKNFSLMGYFDLINVENCFLDNGNKKIFNIILNDSNNNNEINLNNDEINGKNNYSIEADNEESALGYVNSINFVSQLVKYRIYLRDKKKGNNRKI